MEAALLIQLKELVKERLDLTSETSDEQLRNVIEEIVFEYSEHSYMTASRKKKWVERLVHSFRGLDMLQPLINNRTITEIMIIATLRFLLNGTVKWNVTKLRLKAGNAWRILFSPLWPK